MLKMMRKAASGGVRTCHHVPSKQKSSISRPAPAECWILRAAWGGCQQWTPLKAALQRHCLPWTSATIGMPSVA
jgi:hypothetical protein